MAETEVEMGGLKGVLSDDMRKGQVDSPATKGLKTNGQSEEYKGHKSQPAPGSTCPFPGPSESTCPFYKSFLHSDGWHPLWSLMQRGEKLGAPLLPWRKSTRESTCPFYLVPFISLYPSSFRIECDQVLFFQILKVFQDFAGLDRSVVVFTRSPCLGRHRSEDLQP